MNYKEYVIFRLAGESYGVDIDNVSNIEKHIDITRIPYTKKFVQGVINLRGNIIPVLNIRERFGFERKEIDTDTRIIILTHSDVTIGLLVDSSSEVVQIDQESIEQAPARDEDSDAYVSEIGKVDERIIMLLELDKLIHVDILAE